MFLKRLFFLFLIFAVNFNLLNLSFADPVLSSVEKNCGCCNGEASDCCCHPAAPQPVISEESLNGAGLCACSEETIQNGMLLKHTVYFKAAKFIYEEKEISFIQISKNDLKSIFKSLLEKPPRPSLS